MQAAQPIGATLIVILASAAPAGTRAQTPVCPPAPPSLSEWKAKASVELSLVSKLLSSMGIGVEYEKSAKDAFKQFQNPDQMYERLSLLYINCVEISKQFPNDPAQRRAEINKFFTQTLNRPLTPDPSLAPKETLRLPTESPKRPEPSQPRIPPPSAAKDKPAALLPAATTTASPKATSDLKPLTSREQWQYNYFFTTKKGYYHVIVASFPQSDEHAAFAKLEQLEKRFPNVGFQLIQTYGQGSGSNFAIVIGTGLPKSTAIALRNWARENGLAADTYAFQQTLNPECVTEKQERGWDYECT